MLVDRYDQWKTLSIAIAFVALKYRQAIISKLFYYSKRQQCPLTTMSKYQDLAIDDTIIYIQAMEDKTD